MLMESFEVENFRSLKHLKLEKLARVNLLVGKNNSGKTSVLEGLYVVANTETGDWVKSIDNGRRLSSENEDFRLLFHNFDSNHPIKFSAHYISDGNKNDSLELGALIELTDRPTTPNSKASSASDRLDRLVSSMRRPLSPYVLRVTLQHPFAENSPQFEISREGPYSSQLKTRPQDEFTEEFLATYANHVAIQRNVTRQVSTELDTFQLGHDLESLKVAKQEKNLLNSLRLIDPRIESFDLGANSEIYVNLGEKFKRLSPLSLLGEGIQRLFAIIAAIASTTGGIILIDEIDNGLHYSALRILWKGVLQAAREYDVQVFATTHSAEALRHLTWVLDDEEYKDYRDDVAAYTLIRANDDTVRSYRYDYEQLDFAMEHDIEVRN